MSDDVENMRQAKCIVPGAEQKDGTDETFKQRKPDDAESAFCDDTVEQSCDGTNQKQNKNGCQTRNIHPFPISPSFMVSVERIIHEDKIHRRIVFFLVFVFWSSEIFES